MSQSQMGFELEKASGEGAEGSDSLSKAAPDSSVSETKSDSEPKLKPKSKEPMVLSVSEINSTIRGLLEGQFNKVWIRGEISNFKPHSSGHWYFSLKDENSQISAVMFRGLNQKVNFKPQNGMEVLVRGKVTVYEPRGSYQIFCESLEPMGAGALQRAFEELKAKLQKEGLFDSSRKRALPSFPRHIGIVTSPTGAAIQDILNVLRRRFKAAKITLSPAVVQGEPAPASIVEAIEKINQLKDVDVLIVGRGGGSMEDLWAFNDERVARAIVASQIPVISAVGHEVDFTIADFVADLRAPTPSAAAELVVKNAQDLLEKLEQTDKRILRSVSQYLSGLRDQLGHLGRRLIDPRRRLQDFVLRCDDLSLRLESALFRHIESLRMRVQLSQQKMGSPLSLIGQISHEVEGLEAKIKREVDRKISDIRLRFRESVGRLEAMSPLKVVERGYSIVRVNQKIIKDQKQLKVGQIVDVRLARGEFSAEVKSCRATETKLFD